MKNLIIPKPISGGLILSYKCSGECKHCMYLCSPKWNDDWLTEKDLESILTHLSKKIQPSPYGDETISLNYGLHITGGEPFLNYDLLLKSVEIAKKLEIPSLFVETNCYWCKNDESTREKLVKLKKVGLNGILISVNPFILEYVPFERTKRAIKISIEIFGQNIMIYQIYYYHQFIKLNIKDRLPLEKYLQYISINELKKNVEFFWMGRAPYKLNKLYKKYPLRDFLNDNCSSELVRSWHCHFDNYRNYIPGYCGGLSWGDIRNLNSLCTDGIDLDNFPILYALIRGKIDDLYIFATKNFGYEELKEGYVSKCHVCFDIRKEIALKTNRVNELTPIEFYHHI
ncbi:MAG: radical SAM protein [Promethearchaeota archaeon]